MGCPRGSLPPPGIEGAGSSRGVDASRNVATGAENLFLRGIAAFRTGRYQDADALLQSFVAANPQDARIEDAAFLRAVSRARLGDKKGSAILAREYLRRFPQGMRRPEAHMLATDPR